MSLNKTVSERIRARREQLGLLRIAAADLSGLTYPRYCSIERAETQITVDDLAKIARALQTNTHDLIMESKIEN